MNASLPPPDCDVLVVGAGPTGLTLAAQLLARGIHTRIIDKDPGTPRLSRAIGIGARTLESLDAMGIVDRFLDEGHRARGVSVYSGTKRLVGIDMAYTGSIYRFQLHLPQQRTEELLCERVAELGGGVERGVELVGCTEDRDGIVATVQDGDGRVREITAAYLVGCDGAHSRVRHLLDVPFLGQAYPWDWLFADARLDWSGRSDEVHVFAHPDGLPLACVPITPHLWRLSLPTPGDRGGAPPTLEEIQSLVDERGPGGMTVSDPETLTSLRCQIRSTSTYRRGRVLLAGDAVHIHSPAGGQGMNTGMLDATNLAWKLALVVQGRTADTLLDTYGQERGPVAAEVLRFSQGLVRFATAPRSLRRSVRDAALPAFRLPPLQRRLARRMSQTAVSYGNSQLSRRRRVAGLPEPGHRMPDVLVGTVDRRTRLYESLRRGRHVLLGPQSAADMVALEPYREVVDVVTAPADVLDGTALVRPDGYVAAVGAAGDLASILGYLRGLLVGPASSGALRAVSPGFQPVALVSAPGPGVSAPLR
jgi:2-polyprenyl-6-methoxyphenol hydroxylase-like FAD-dependent oxidoreductase